MTAEALAREVARAAAKLGPGQLSALIAALSGVATPAEPGGRSKVVGAVKAPAFGDVAGRLFDAWAASDDGLTGPGVALALDAVRISAERRAEPTVSLVVTGPTTQQVPTGSIFSALKDVIRAAEQRLIIVTFAAYKIGDLIEELTAAVERGVEVTLILETDKAGGGTLTFDAKKAFADLNGKARFYVWPPEKRPGIDGGKASMHAKAAIADDGVALVTSANLTDRAVSDNLELGVLIRGGDVPRRLGAHFRELIAAEVLAEARP
jgi:phosphatidylserine/phosphatidylglycerophosphate/cardiolipin synthase-like enzyme